MGITQGLVDNTTARDSPETNSDEASDNEGDSGVVWDPFVDLCKRRFLWYFDSYLLAISKYKTEVEDGQKFIRMPFEGSANDMVGSFNYTKLESRLRTIKDKLDTETKTWAREGTIAATKTTGVYVNLQRQFEQCVEFFKRENSVTLDIELINKNAFEWAVTYFGRPMTNLDGGLFRIRINFSTRFPEEQPRAVFETPMFHHRIASDGTTCYTSDRPEDVKSHIIALIAALEEENPPYDPRTMVNPEAAKLYWGSAEDKKMYNRKLRRAVQRSVE